MRFVRLNDNNIIRGIRWANKIVEGEVAHETAQIGDIMQEDGSFITPEPEPKPEYIPVEQRFEALDNKLTEILTKVTVIEAK